MKRIPLGKTSNYALVDDEDFEKVSQFTWHYTKNKKARTGYAKCHMYMGRIGDKNKFCRMRLHRFILKPKDTEEIDHIDGNGLNCCKNNMRLCSHKLNSQNVKTRTSSKKTSKYKGVTRLQSGHWHVRITKDGKTQHIGTYKNEDEAGMAYNIASIRLFKRYAKLNEISGPTNSFIAFSHYCQDCGFSYVDGRRLAPCRSCGSKNVVNCYRERFPKKRLTACTE